MHACFKNFLTTNKEKIGAASPLSFCLPMSTQAQLIRPQMQSQLEKIRLDVSTAQITVEKSANFCSQLSRANV